MMEKSKFSLFTLVVLSVVGLVFLMTNGVNADAPADTISYWKLDEDPAPAEYVDSVGTNNGAAGLALAPVPTPGVVPIPTVTVPNTAQLFDGATTGIDVAAPAADTDFNWAAGDSFSIEFWMKTNTDRVGAAAATNEVIIGRDDTNPGPGVIHWWVGLDNTGPNFAAFVLSDTGVVGPNDPNLAVRGTTDIGDGGWHHIVAVRDSVAEELRLYVDSILENTTATAAYAVGFSSDTEKLTIGYMDFGGVSFVLDGAIDEVSLYDSAFDQADVDEHYAAGLAGEGIDTLVDDADDDDTKKKSGGGSSGGCFIGAVAE